MQDDTGEQAESEEYPSKHKRWNDQFDDTSVCRLIGIPCVPRGKHEGLKDHRACKERPPLSKPVTDQCRNRQGRRSEQALFPEPGLRRLCYGRKGRNIVREYVGIYQRVRRRPPAEFSLREEIKDDFIREERRHQQKSGKRLAEDGGRRGNITGPHFP